MRRFSNSSEAQAVTAGSTMMSSSDAHAQANARYGGTRLSNNYSSLSARRGSNSSSKERTASNPATGTLLADRYRHAEEVRRAASGGYQYQVTNKPRINLSDRHLNRLRDPETGGTSNILGGGGTGSKHTTGSKSSNAAKVDAYASAYNSLLSESKDSSAHALHYSTSYGASRSGAPGGDRDGREALLQARAARERERERANTDSGRFNHTNGSIDSFSSAFLNGEMPEPARPATR